MINKHTNKISYTNAEDSKFKMVNSIDYIGRNIIHMKTYLMSPKLVKSITCFVKK